MQLQDIIAVSSKVELSPQGEKEVYRSSIHDVEEGQFAVVVPYLRGEWLVLQTGDLVKVSITSENERFVFETRILARKKEQVPLYILETPQPSQIKRVQLRDYVRIKTTQEVFYQKISQEDLDNVHSLNPETAACTVDISGGGLCIALKEVLSVGQLLLLKIPIPGQETQPILTIGSVKRFKPAGEMQSKHLVGLKFERIAERDRDRLIQYIFDKMRKQRWLEVEK